MRRFPALITAAAAATVLASGGVAAVALVGHSTMAPTPIVALHDEPATTPDVTVTDDTSGTEVTETTEAVGTPVDDSHGGTVATDNSGPGTTSEGPAPTEPPTVKPNPTDHSGHDGGEDPTTTTTPPTTSTTVAGTHDGGDDHDTEDPGHDSGGDHGTDN